MAESLKTQEPIAVANFVINLANENKLSVTNLQLQKILFFLQGYTLSKYQVGIVNGSFSKWQYGPVQKNVYRTFRDNGASPITNEYSDAYFDELGQFKTQTPEMKSIDNNVRDVLKSLVLKLLRIPVWNENLCVNCGLCKNNCPQKAIVNEGSSYTSLDNLCIGCGICEAVCPRKAWEMKPNC